LARYHGRSGRLYAAISGAGTAVPVASLTNWTLNAATDRVEVTAFGDSNKVYVQGLQDVTGDFSGFWDDTETTLSQAARSADGTKLYLYPSTNAASKYAYGPAWVDVSWDVGVGGAVAISGSFAANGSWDISRL
jgi:hypothetical protein